MGIQGLLPVLKSIMNPIHIRELEGCSVAVDTYSWLHKGALSCSTELCKGLHTSKHIDYCMHRVNMLRHYGIRPILVFDGGPLPMKGDQETKRARSRRENLSRAMEHESNGNKTAAYECYQKAVDISPLMAYDLIKVLKQENVSYIVAPYEADAQMTFLALNKQVEAVITEDSDLIAFGCPRIIYKMDKFGQGVEFKNAMIQQNKDLNLAGFTQMMLLEMCILSGCDYLQSLPGMGLKKAHALIKRFRSHEKVIKHLQYSGVELTPLYEESFKKAIFTFRHQRVYDPVTEGLVHLSEPAHVIDDDFEFLGPSLPQHVAKGIALGDVDPFTKNPIQGETGDADVVTRGIYQLKKFKPDGEKKRVDLPVQKNLLTNYFCLASVEAKQKFKAPRITPKHPNEHNGISSPQLYETKQDMSSDNLDSPESRDHGLYDDRGTDDGETREFNSVCKPCTSLHKNRETEPENEKVGVGNKNVIVRSSYFMQKPRETICDLSTNSDTKFENIMSSFLYKPQPALPDGKCKNVEKRVVRSSYFQHKNSKGNYNSETENTDVDCPVTKNRFGSGAGDCKVAAEIGKDRVQSSYFLNVTANEDDVKPASEDMVTRCNVATETCNDSVNGRLSDDSLSGCATRKRKFTQTNSSMEEANCTSPPSGICTSEREEEAKAEETQFGCNISHLSRYSGIAEKSMENFVSVISSFRYNSSGSRASGLRRPPLKDIKNNCMESSKPAVDLSKFVYAPTKKTTPRGRKANF